MKEKYAERLTKIEEYLQTILPEKVNKNWKDAVVGNFSQVTAPEKLKNEFLDMINAPARDLLGRGGKRWRPVLMTLFYELYRGDDRILPLTPLVELPHNGTLIVDDIEDSSDFRRGKPAVHLLYGTDVSINTGNLLYFLPHVLIDSCDFSDEIKLSAYRYYSETMTRLHIGQGLDIQWHNCDYIPTVDEYMAMCSFKTGGLALFSGRMGVRAGGGSEMDALRMGTACEAMGIGFQIVDDVTNLVTGNPGKKRGDDIVEGKKSLPVILFRENGGDMKRLSEFFSIAGKLGIDAGNDAVEEAIALIQKSGALELALAEAHRILDSSRDRILSAYKPCEALDIIAYIFDSFAKSVKLEEK